MFKTKEKIIINTKILFFIICMYVLTFQNFLENHIEIFRYFDEALSIIAIPIIFLNFFPKVKKEYKEYFCILILLFGIFILGIASNIIYKYQTIKYIVSDIIVCNKFFMILFLSSIVLKKNLIEKYKKEVAKHSRIIVNLLLILTILNYVINFFPSEKRFGIKVNTLFYSAPTYLAAICIFYISLNFIINDKKSKKYICILVLILISTLRFKAIGAAILAVLVSVYIDRTNRKIKISKMIILAVIAVIISYEQIGYYYFNDGYARNELTVKSLEIAKDFYPLGSGFGTYASYFSVVNYSPMYYEYGLSNIFGLTEDNPNFVSDVFWPMVLGQFGVFGFIIYIICIIILFSKIQKDYSLENKKYYIAKMICFIYLIISSTSESAFVNPLSISLAIIIGIQTKNETNNERRIYERSKNC